MSRRQLALLEKGGNVSVQFLLRIANYLGLSTLPLDGSVQLVSGQSGSNVFELIQSLDLLSALAEHIRAYAVEAVLPPSERGRLKDTPAFSEFVARHLGDADGAERMAKTLLEVVDDVGRPDSPRLVHEVKAPSRGTRKMRRRAG